MDAGQDFGSWIWNLDLEIGVWKFETDKIISQFIALKPKIYSILLNNNVTTSKLKSFYFEIIKIFSYLSNYSSFLNRIVNKIMHDQIPKIYRIILNF